MKKHELKCQLSVLSRPDGSALCCEGETTVLAGIYGPIEVKMQKILIDKASVECHYRPKAGHPGVEDRFRESMIRNVCETALAVSLYPRTAVLITLQEMHDSGQLISCAINASCLACLDSGIDMKFMYAGVTCFLLNDEQLCFVPPITEKGHKAMFVFVFNNTNGDVLASHTEGSFTKGQYGEALQISRTESQSVFEFFKKTVSEKLSR